MLYAPKIRRSYEKIWKKLHAVVLNRKNFNTTNIAKLQENILKYFQANPEHVIMQANKNLVPYVMNR